MTDIERWSGGGLASRDARQTSRALSRQQVRKQLREGLADLETDVAITKAEDYTMATGTSMQSVVRIAKLQEQLELMSPASSARLNYLADSHGLGVGDLLQDLRCTLRRI